MIRSTRTHTIELLKPLPKAELHVHVEGILTPEDLQRLAARNHKQIPENLVNDQGAYSWTTFIEFLNQYDVAADFLASKEDYSEIVYHYLKKRAEHNTLYVEFICSSEHARALGLSYSDYVNGIASGIDLARKHFSIEARMNMAGVRHYGPEAIQRQIEALKQNPHPYVTGFNLAGNEHVESTAFYAQWFQEAKRLGLGLTAHAGEACGAESIKEAILNCQVERLGHGVRIFEDPQVVALAHEKGIHFEVCPSSNLELGVFSPEDYPLERFREEGFHFSLNSDDPPFFHTTLEQEYALAYESYHFKEQDLLNCTRAALSAAFVDQSVRKQLLKAFESQVKAAQKREL